MPVLYSTKAGALRVADFAAVVGAVAVILVVWLVIFMSYLSHVVGGLSRGGGKLFCFFFGDQNRSSQHVPALPVSSRRQARLLEEYARKCISAVVCDAVAGGLASAHGGL